MISFKFKVLLLGSASVGKTSLVLRFVNDIFKENYSPTIGAQFLTKVVKLSQDETKDDLVGLNIWDIAGQKRFFDLRTTFYRGAQGALLVYDLTRKETFEELNEWFDEMTPVLGDSLPIVMMGNKSDLKKARKVKVSEAKELAKAKKCLHLETSAKTGNNVERAFWELARLVAMKEGGMKIEITKKIVKKKIKIALKEKGGASYLIKSKVRAYIKSNGLKTSSKLLDGNALNRIIAAMLDKAIERTKSNGRKTVQPRDI